VRSESDREEWDWVMSTPEGAWTVRPAQQLLMGASAFA